MSIELHIPEARASFIQLDDWKQFVNTQGVASGEFRKGITFLVPVGSEIDKKIRAALLQVATAKWGAEKAPGFYEAIMSQTNKTCYVDGKTKPQYDGYKGMMALTAYRKQKDGAPIVRDNDATDIYDAKTGKVNEGKGGRLYSGVWVRGKVDFFASVNGGNGLRCGLQVVQRLRKGDAFGGGAAPTADEFGEVAEGADAEDLS